MSLVQAYLLEVSQHLPANERSDIIAELGDHLESEVTRRCEAQPAMSAEQAQHAVLESFGHPLRVAAGYRSQQHLIGPELYPAFLYALKTLLTFVLTLQILVTALVWFAGSTPWQVNFAGLFSQLLNTAAWVTGLTTAVFAAIEYSGDKLGWYDKWQPTDLKLQATAGIRRTDLLTNLITAVAFLLWWNEAVLLPSAIDSGNTSVIVTLAAAWNTIYWPANGIVGASVLLYLLVLARGCWQRQTLIAEIGLNTALIALVAWLLSTGPLLQISGSGDLAPLLESGLQRTAKIIVIVVAGFSAWDTWLAWKRLGLSKPGANGSLHPTA